MSQFRRHSSLRRQSGLTLIELLVALGLGLTSGFPVRLHGGRLHAYGTQHTQTQHHNSYQNFDERKPRLCRGWTFCRGGCAMWLDRRFFHAISLRALNRSRPAVCQSRRADYRAYGMFVRLCPRRVRL